MMFKLKILSIFQLPVKYDFLPLQKFSLTCTQGLIQDVFVRGACSSVLKLRGSGDLLYQENFEIYYL